MADRIVAALDGWSQRSQYTGQNELVFAHPQTDNPLDRSKVAKRFKEACAEAAVTEITFHELRHTFATTMAANSVPLRKIQEWLGHADGKTTQIYTHYAPTSTRSRWSTTASRRRPPTRPSKGRPSQNDIAK